MKLISYNIRGLGSFEKKKEIQKMVKRCHDYQEYGSCCYYSRQVVEKWG